jgi:UDP-N-acetylmuramoyl-L-alanyl-D-glutamate--2,6-diaminopimelate ligase
MAIAWNAVADLLEVPSLPPGAPSGQIAGVESRPERIRQGDLFFAFPEFHTYQRWWTLEEILAAAVPRRPALVVGPLEMPTLPVPCLRVRDPAKSCARVAAAHFGFPRAVPIIGVTGTNGKTTTAKLLAHLWNAVRGPAADLGTLGTFLRGRAFAEAEYTTDLAVELHRKLAAVGRAGAGMVAMEVSSHALALDRVAAVPFAAGVLTNVTRDHLDFHRSEAAYRAAKARLFASLAPDALAVINADEPVAPEFAAATSAPVVTFGRQSWADLRLLESAFTVSGTDFAVAWGGREWRARTALIGGFQLHNVLAAAATLLALGLDPEALWAALPGFQAVSGRMERLPVPGGAAVVIDYAHNPDGLEQVLRACRAMEPRRLWVVFGCGGDRDRGKRPLMAAVAESWADGGWITSDNPRTEDPATITDEIRGGLREPARFPVEIDRAAAIHQGLAACGPGDVLLIAGKGHEDYQIIGTEKWPFSDHAVVRDWLAAREA